MTPTPEQVEAWAREAGAEFQLPHDNATYTVWEFDSDDGSLARFAALACAWQRERDAQICEDQSCDLSLDVYRAALRQLKRKAEAIRSDCADVAKG